MYYEDINAGNFHHYIDVYTQKIERIEALYTDIENYKEMTEVERDFNEYLNSFDGQCRKTLDLLLKFKDNPESFVEFDNIVNEIAWLKRYLLEERFIISCNDIFSKYPKGSVLSLYLNYTYHGFYYYLSPEIKKDTFFITTNQDEIHSILSRNISDVLYSKIAKIKLYIGNAGYYRGLCDTLAKEAAGDDDLVRRIHEFYQLTGRIDDVF